MGEGESGGGDGRSLCQQLVARHSVAHGERQTVLELVHAQQADRERRLYTSPHRGSRASRMTRISRASVASVRSRVSSAASSPTCSDMDGASTASGRTRGTLRRSESERRRSSEALASITAMRKRVLALVGRARKASMVLRRVSEVLLAKLDEDTPAAEVQLSQLERALGPRPDGLQALEKADASAHTWWVATFGATEYVASSHFVSKLAERAGALLAPLVEEDAERAVLRVVNYSELQTHVSAMDAAMFFAAFGPLDPREAYAEEFSSTALRKKLNAHCGPSNHILAKLHAVLSTGMFIPGCSIDPCEHLDGLRSGSFFLRYGETPGVLSCCVVGRAGGVDCCRMVRSGRGGHERWRCETPYSSVNARTIPEAVELMEPLVQSHLPAGDRWTLPWADPRGEVDLWGSQAEAAAAATDGTAAAICEAIREYLADQARRHDGRPAHTA
eukprot:TRINITY_DN7920_c0_g2_i1.p1 TRINITY_DN7920_c0_g2~~TRINITY_DN7920_c0_g2_i1.p1  ORF type:complete len:447 (+),score=105.87 TRINITY_DN7920_c0_g2_i1:39-1379(+)